MPNTAATAAMDRLITYQYQDRYPRGATLATLALAPALALGCMALALALAYALAPALAIPSAPNGAPLALGLAVLAPLLAMLLPDRMPAPLAPSAPSKRPPMGRGPVAPVAPVAPSAGPLAPNGYALALGALPVRVLGALGGAKVCTGKGPAGPARIGPCPDRALALGARRAAMLAMARGGPLAPLALPPLPPARGSAPRRGQRA